MSIALLPATQASSSTGPSGFAAMTQPDSNNAANFFALLNLSGANPLSLVPATPDNAASTNNAPAVSNVSPQPPAPASPSVAVTAPPRSVDIQVPSQRQASNPSQAPNQPQESTSSTSPSNTPTQPQDNHGHAAAPATSTVNNDQPGAGAANGHIAIAHSDTAQATGNTDASSSTTGDGLPSQEQLRAKLQDQLAAIDQILTIVIQLLTGHAPATAAASDTAGAGNTAAVTPVAGLPGTGNSASAPVTGNTGAGGATDTPPAATAVNTSSGSLQELLAAAAAAAGQLLPGQAVPGGNPLPSTTDAAITPAGSSPAPADPLTLLQDYQAIIKQLQQLLANQSSVNPSATPNQAAAPTPTSIPLLLQLPLQVPLAALSDGNQSPTPTVTGDAASAVPSLPIAPNGSPLLTDNTPPSTASGNGSTDMSLLQQMLVNLSQLIGPQDKQGGATSTLASQAVAEAKPADGSSAPSLVVPAATPAQVTPPSENILSLLKLSISEVRQQLQKLSSQNEAVFSQAQNDAQAMGIDVKQLFSTALAANTPAAGSSLAVSYSAAVAPQVQNAPPPLAGNNFPAGIGIVPIQANADNSANSGSDNNSQGQSLPQGIIQAGAAAQPQSASPAGSSSFSQLLEQQPPTHLRDQVAFQVKTALNDGSSKIAIQLHPADLGKVDIRLSVDADGKTSVTVTADNHHTLDLLQRDAQGLSRALNDAGLKTDSGSLSFNLSNGQQQQQQQQQQANNQNTVSQPVATYQNAQPDEEQESNLAILTRSYVVNVAEGLDIQI